MTLNANIRRLQRQAAADLKRHEGFREYAYPDPLSLIARKYRKMPWGFKPARELLALIPEGEQHGHPWTVGYGFTHGVTPDSRMSESLAARKLDEKVPQYLGLTLRIIPDLLSHPYVVQTVFLNMVFNMGNRVATFKNTLGFLRNRNYPQVAENLEKSLWFRQTGARAVELVDRIRTLEIKKEHLVQ